jgi:hypothetical protein
MKWASILALISALCILATLMLQVMEYLFYTS